MEFYQVSRMVQRQQLLSSMDRKMRKPPVEEFVENLVPGMDYIVDPITKCWEWQWGKTGGYGQIGRDSKRYLVHRLVCDHFHGLPDHMKSIHSCDNPGCINPDHLRAGTQKENVRDAVIRNRWTRGEKNGRAKFTNKQAIEIKNRYSAGDVTYKSLANEYGVSDTCIAFIVRGKRYGVINE